METKKARMEEQAMKMELDNHPLIDAIRVAHYMTEMDLVPLERAMLITESYLTANSDSARQHRRSWRFADLSIKKALKTLIQNKRKLLDCGVGDWISLIQQGQTSYTTFIELVLEEETRDVFLDAYASSSAAASSLPQCHPRVPPPRRPYLPTEKYHMPVLHHQKAQGRVWTMGG